MSPAGTKNAPQSVTPPPVSPAGVVPAEGFFRTLIEHSTDAIYVVDRNGTVMYANPAAETMFGVPLVELLGASAFGFLHPDDLVRAATMLGEAVGDPLNAGFMATRVRDARGYWRHVEVSARSLGEADPVDHVIVSVRDVTEREHAQHALRESEELFRAAFLSSAVGILITSPVGIILGVNAAFCRLVGRSESELRGRNVEVVVPAERTEENRRVRAAILAGEMATLTRETPYLSAGGTERYGVVSLALVRSPDGAPRYFVSQLVDITEARTAAEAQRQSEERYRQLVETTTDIVIGLDSEGCIRFGNRAFRDALEVAEDELLGQPVFDVVAPELKRAARAVFRRLAHNGKPTEVNGILVARSGRRRAVEGSLTPQRNGKFLGAILILRDVSERQRLESQLRQAQRMEAVGQLAGGVAHDFNNLLTVIRSYADMLHESIEDPDARKDLGEIRRASDRAASLTRQLLAFSRKQLLQPRRLDLNAVVTDLGSMLRRLIGEDIVIRNVLGESLHAVCADPGQLEQVIVNLAVNAQDAMPNGGVLTIETANVTLSDADTIRHGISGGAGRYVMLAVTDNGVGMDAAVQARIFEPFFTTKETGKGTGLGLATVYGIVKQSGGFIWCYSEVGQGTTFKIYLPLDLRDAPAAEGSGDESSARGGTESILLVEDDERLRALGERVLSRAGYRVTVARNGAEALAIARNGVHAVVTDLVMPEMSGRELGERLRDLGLPVKVLFMSGYTDDEIFRRGLLTPGTAFLQKPFSAEALTAAVRRLLDAPRTAPAAAV